MDEIKIPAVLYGSKFFSSDEKLILGLVLAHERAINSLDWNVNYPYGETATMIGKRIGKSRAKVLIILTRHQETEWIESKSFKKSWTRETILQNKFYQDLGL
jgi:hypothetical protein